MQEQARVSELNITAEEFAEIVAKKFEERHACRLSPADQQAVKDLIQTKRSAVRAFVWICGAFVLWIMKDIYVYIINHLTFK